MDMLVHNIKVTSKHVTLKLDRAAARRVFWWIEAAFEQEKRDLDAAAKKLADLLAQPDPDDEERPELGTDEFSEWRQRLDEHRRAITEQRFSVIHSGARADEMWDFIIQAADCWNWDHDWQDQY